MGALSVSGVAFPVNSKPLPPNRQRLPALSVQPAAPYRPPGLFVKGFGIDVGAVEGNDP
jgi:hypothetical protein